MPIQRRSGLPVDGSLENIPVSQVGKLAVRVGALRYPIAGGTFTITTVAAMVGTAPTGATLILDVNVNGTTIFSTQGNRPTFAISATSATVSTFSTTSVTTGDYVTVDIDQVGSTLPGSDLVCVLRLQRSA